MLPSTFSSASPCNRATSSPWQLSINCGTIFISIRTSKQSRKINGALLFRQTPMPPVCFAAAAVPSLPALSLEVKADECADWNLVPGRPFTICYMLTAFLFFSRFLRPTRTSSCVASTPCSGMLRRSTTLSFGIQLVKIVFPKSSTP